MHPAGGAARLDGVASHAAPVRHQAFGVGGHVLHAHALHPDIRVQGVSVEDVAAYAESLMPDRGGVGRYPVKAGRAAGWVHVDTRADKARWRG